MALPRRLLPVVALLALVLLVFALYKGNVHKNWRDIPQKVGLGEWSSQNDGPLTFVQPVYEPGEAESTREYSKVMVVARTKEEDVEWMDEAIPNFPKAIYVADDPSAELHPPINKGHEVMVYLTYIIDNYENLPDVMVFMHAHRWSWHNLDVLGDDAAAMMNRLNPARVVREGFMNVRCQWYPGCPDWMHPGETEYDEYKSEQILIAKAWVEIFPKHPVPDVLASPCCSQFAVSKERMLSIPKEHFEHYRSWMRRTPLEDFVSGRVWEYMWQFVFTGKPSHCPVEHICTCDGFGVCFGGKEQYDMWFSLRNLRSNYNHDLHEWEDKGIRIQAALDNGKPEEAEKLPKPEEGKDEELKTLIIGLDSRMQELVQQAIRRGDDPKLRAEECGREWKEGDGF